MPRFQFPPAVSDEEFRRPDREWFPTRRDSERDKNLWASKPRNQVEPKTKLGQILKAFDEMSPADRDELLRKIGLLEK